MGKGKVIIIALTTATVFIALSIGYKNEERYCRLSLLNSVYAESPQERITSLQKQIIELKQKADICSKLANEFTGICKQMKSKFGSSYLYAHAAAKTAEALNAHKNFFLGTEGSAARAYSITLGIEAELADPKTRRVPPVFSLERFQGLESAISSYGVVESANIWLPENTQLIWKQKLSAIPPDLKLISSGNYRGFLVGDNGDLVIPGLQFYREVLAGNAPDFSEIKNHFRTILPMANEDLRNKRYPQATYMLVDLLEFDRMPPQISYVCYNNAGYCLIEMGIKDKGHGRITIYPDRLRAAIELVDCALSIKPKEANTYLLKIRALIGLSKYDEAIESIDQGLRNVTDSKGRSALTERRDNLLMLERVW